MYTITTDISTLITEITSYSNQHMVMLSIAEATSIDITELINVLNQKGIAFIGGIFPRIIHQNTLYDTGIVITQLHHAIESHIIKNLHQNDFVIPNIELKKEESYCMLTFVDGLTSNISLYLSELYRHFGNQTSYFGGGAGSLSLQQQPCVFNHEGIFMDAAVLCVIKNQIEIGVKHGWQKIDGPIVATKTHKNIIQEINWMNAFEVYQELLKKDTDKQINEQNFFDIAKGYPFGIVKQNSECVVRDPIATNEKGELICVGEVPENTILDVLKGENDSLIKSAKEATQLALNASHNPSHAFIIDCISRVLFLEDDFDTELNAIHQALVKTPSITQINGALTLGEISSYNGYLEFFNKTIVIGLLK
ncbi:FIST signal transduction protein [Aquimarina rhabdastrellae]